MSITLQRTPELSRQHTGEQVRPEVQQSQFAERINREVRQTDQQVNQSHRGEDQSVEKDGRGQSGAGGNTKKRAKKEKAETKRKSGGLLDIMA